MSGSLGVRYGGVSSRGAKVTRMTSSFSWLLKHLRLAARLTQEELAERAHLSARAISDLERGVKVAPRRDTVELLACALGVPVDDLERSVSRRRGIRTTRNGERLPVPPTPLVGRGTDVRNVVELLRTEFRLVTVTGPAGIGKTRLALSVAEAMLDDFADGVVYIPLASLREPSLVMSTVAEALGILHDSSTPAAQRVTGYLQPRQMLLVIDNFEHLLSAATELAHVLAVCPAVKLLVTSRTALNLQSESRFELAPLRMPSRDREVSNDEVDDYSALALFVARARSVKPGFAVTPTNLAAIAAICRRLDGLPLAIELASSRANVLSPQALLERLESRLDVLTGGALDLPERHQTMRGAIGWSYNLLDDEEQRLFRRLAIFAGTFTLEAAEAVAVSGNVTTSEVLNDLTSLVEKSLVVVEPGDASETRFAMLETIREFGIECLAKCGESDVMSDRHCEYYVCLVERSYVEQVGDKQSLWFHRLERELDNLRLAAQWIVKKGNAQRAVRFGLSLWRFWERTHVREGRGWLDTFLNMPVLAPPNPSRGPLLFAAGRLAYRQADYVAAQTYLQECLSIARSENEVDFVSGALTQLGHVAYASGNLNAAEDHYNESLTIRRGRGDARTIGITLHGLARIHRARGDFERSRALLEEELANSRAAQDVVNISMVLAGLGLVALLQGDSAGAERRYRESLVLATNVGHQFEIGTALLGLALAAIGSEDPDRALPLLRECLTIASNIGARSLVALCLEGFAANLAISGQARVAWRLAGGVAAYRQRELVPGDPSERILLNSFLGHAARSLDDDDRAALWAAGRTLTFLDMVSEATHATPESHHHLPVPYGADSATAAPLA